MTEGNKEENLGVRRVTNAHASWTESPERGAPGWFTIQLILSDGAEEYVLQPEADDAEVQLKLLRNSEVAYFDLGRKVLIPSNVQLGG